MQKKPKIQPAPPSSVASPWPADQVERRFVDDLVPYARNSRTHEADQIEKIAASIKEFGWTVPVLVAEDGIIIAGHGRVIAAKHLGIVEVPVMVARGWTDEQRRAYTIADNALTDGSKFDDELLRIELGELFAEGFDIGLTGLSESKIEDLLSNVSLPDPAEDRKGNLSERFGIPPFSVMSAREGWWQDRKRAWLGIGIQSELGRGDQLIPNSGSLSSKARYDANATPGGSLLPAANYSKTKARGNGKGKPING